MRGKGERRRKPDWTTDDEVPLRTVGQTPLPVDRTGRLAGALLRGDGGARADVLTTLQRLAGNAAVQREVVAEPTTHVDLGAIGRITVMDLSWHLMPYSGGKFEEIRFVLGMREARRVGPAIRDAYATDHIFAVVKTGKGDVMRGARIVEAVGDPGQELKVRIKGNLKRKRK